MKTEYDVLVIGGGPSGAIAARTTAEKGLDTCIIEKRPAIGTPVRCAEGIGKKQLYEFIRPDPRWISAEIKRAAIISPDMTRNFLNSSITESKIGYVLERKLFDRELVSHAAHEGAEIYVKTYAKSPVVEDGRVKGAIIGGEISRIQAGVVIAADGVESQFSRRCGVDTQVKPEDMLCCAQYLMTDIDLDHEMAEFYFGNNIAPGGYAWVFPKGERTANVGIGILGSRSREDHRAKDFLTQFVRKNYSEGKSLELMAGGVPVGKPLSCTVSDGLIITGDAARVSDPLTGGGIYNAMVTGQLAGETAAECIDRGDCSRTALLAYDKGWRSSPMGKSLGISYKLRQVFNAVTDEKLNMIAHSLKRLEFKDLTVSNVLKELIIRNPGLVWDLRSVISGLNNHGV